MQAARASGGAGRSAMKAFSASVFVGMLLAACGGSSGSDDGSGGAPPAAALLDGYALVASKAVAVDAQGTLFDGAGGGMFLLQHALTGPPLGLLPEEKVVTSGMVLDLAATDDFVYAQGDDSGVVCVNRKTGDPVWRSEASADRVLAANNEFLYVRDRQGRFLVYDAKRPTDPATRYSAPLSGIDLREFNIPVTNTASDRIYLAADNGLIVCLRDMSPKYARPALIRS